MPNTCVYTRACLLASGCNKKERKNVTRKNKYNKKSNAIAAVLCYRNRDSGQTAGWQQIARCFPANTDFPGIFEKKFAYDRPNKRIFALVSRSVRSARRVAGETFEPNVINAFNSCGHGRGERVTRTDATICRDIPVARSRLPTIPPGCGTYHLLQSTNAVNSNFAFPIR